MYLRLYISGSTVKTRSPPRSCKTKELLITQDIDLFDGSDDEYDDYWSYRDDAFRSLRRKISEAIKEKDADYLFVLLKQRKINLGYNERWSYKRHRKIALDKVTILSEALNHGDHACIQTILYAIDCGHLPHTLIDHVDPTGRTPLWHACLKGDLMFVQQLVQVYHAHVNRCGVLIVAAQNGHEQIVKFLLENRCDPNRHANNYNERALHAASRRNHLEIVRALLQHGADPTLLDDHRRTALDYAIHKKHLDIAKLLITYHGDRFFMTQDGFTPLMLAARCNNTPIVNIFSKILPEQQFLDELSLVACNYIIHGIAGKRDEAYCYFERALSRSTPVCNHTPCEAYEFGRECQTLDELAQIRNNDDALRMHALLVSERLLLKSHDIGHFLRLIIKQSNIYKWNGLLVRSLQMRIHAYHLILRTERDQHPHDPLLHKKYLTTMVDNLLQIVQTEDNAPIELLAIVWRWIFDRNDNSLTSNLFKLLFIAIYVSISLIKYAIDDHVFIF